MNSELRLIWSLIVTYKVETILIALLFIVIFFFVLSRIKEKSDDYDYSTPTNSKQSILEESVEKTWDMNLELNSDQYNNDEDIDSEVIDDEIKALTSNDIKALGVHQNMTNEEVKRLFGESIDHQCNYQFGSIVFSSMEGFDNTDIELIIDKPNFEAPRGVKIGDHVDSVLLKFPNIKEEESFGNEEEKTLYDTVNENGILTGRIYYDCYSEIESIQFNHILDALWYLEFYITNSIVTCIKYGCSSVDLKTAKEVLY